MNPKERFYDEHIRPLVDEIFDACEGAGIDFLVSADLGMTEDGTGFHLRNSACIQNDDHCPGLMVAANLVDPDEEE